MKDKDFWCGVIVAMFIGIICFGWVLVLGFLYGAEYSNFEIMVRDNAKAIQKLENTVENGVIKPHKHKFFTGEVK